MNYPSAYTRVLLNGTDAVAHAVRVSRPKVIASCPLTPQTPIEARLSRFLASGELTAKLVKVESGESAMASLIGAAAVGVRTFTATSTHILALMHEMLHWAAADRMPIVMAHINGTMGAPWSIWVDHNDSLSQRDTGWIQFYVSSCQETYDTTIQSFKLAESVQLPVMVNLDGYYLSHTAEPVELLEQTPADQFLPAYQAKWKLDVKNPCSIGNVVSSEHYLEFRRILYDAMESAKTVSEKINRQFGEITGRYYLRGLLRKYESDFEHGHSERSEESRLRAVQRVKDSSSHFVLLRMTLPGVLQQSP